MEIILIIILPIIHLVLNRIEWKLNKELYIDMYIGRNEFKKYIQSREIKERLKI